jgi:hypothetical protein
VRRRGLLRLVALGPLCWSGLAHAGSYLNRCAILVVAANRESEFLRSRVTDKDLADVLHSVALARLEAASRMQVPKEVVQAHPHLLLALQNFERAADAASEGHSERFLIYQQRARDEIEILRGVLKQLGWALPEGK